MTIEEFTTIQISRLTRKELAGIGSKDDTYDSIIQKLLSRWSEGDF